MTYLEYYDDICKDPRIEKQLSEIWGLVGLTREQVVESLSKKGEMRPVGKAADD